uniref:Snurportin-1 n=1 Tax=Strigamia maritima TaxID=126957 RepID=T1ILI8_STRMM
MDDLAETLAINFQVTEFPNNPHAPHPRFSQYKLKHKNADQTARRKRLLEEQKLQRYKYVNNKRNLPDDKIPDEDEGEEPMQWEQQQRTKKRRNNGRLMLSEWLVDVPDDLDTNWYFMLCPIGRRCLVMTNKGHTVAFSRNGHFLKQFSSHLPGGNNHEQKSRNEYTTLDCVLSATEHTFYVLDIMCWKGHPVYDSETEFRFYWLNEKLSEVPEISCQTLINPYRFIPLQFFQYSSLEMHRVMSSPAPFQVDLDGILFYHKQTHYVSGPTPLVNWLKAYMIPEVLDVDVMEKYLKERPADYVGITQYKESLSKKLKKNKEVRMDL